MKNILVMIAVIGSSVSAFAKSMEFQARLNQKHHETYSYEGWDHHGSDVTVRLPELSYHIDNPTDLALDSLRVKRTVECIVKGECSSSSVTYHAVNRNGDVQIPASQHQFYSKEHPRYIERYHEFHAELVLVDAKGTPLGFIQTIYPQSEIEERSDLQIFMTPPMRLRIQAASDLLMPTTGPSTLVRQRLPTLARINANLSLRVVGLRLNPHLRVIDPVMGDLIFDQRYFLGDSNLEGSLQLVIEKSFDNETFQRSPLFPEAVPGSEAVGYGVRLSRIANSSVDLDLGKMKAAWVKEKL